MGWAGGVVLAIHSRAPGDLGLSGHKGVASGSESRAPGSLANGPPMSCPFCDRIATDDVHERNEVGCAIPDAFPVSRGPHSSCAREA